jgi:hypothetical protein
MFMLSSLEYILPIYGQGLLPFYVSVIDTTPNNVYCLYPSCHRPYIYTSIYFVICLIH